MKRITGLIILTALIMSMASCGLPVTQALAIPTTTPAATPALTQSAAAPTKTVTPTPTATLTPAPTPSPTPAPTPKKTAKAPSPPSGLVIIATGDNSTSSYGEIRGGYASGKWLTQSEAAAYCKGKMTFYEYDLTRLKGTVVSSGVTHDEGEYADETMPDASGSYDLVIPGVNDEYGDDGEGDYDEGDYDEGDYDEGDYDEGDYDEGGYEAETYADDDSFGYTYLYSGGKLPDMETVEDTSEACLAVQAMLDEKIGEGQPEVSIYTAVSADIDNDGQKETVADVYSDMASLWCVIESDGTVKTVDDDYLNSLYYDNASLLNIIDIDRDGKSELVIDYCWGDDQGTWVFKYDGRNFTKVIDYWVLSPSP